MELRKKQQRGSPRRQAFFLHVTTRFDKQVFFKKCTFGFFRLINPHDGREAG